VDGGNTVFESGDLLEPDRLRNPFPWLARLRREDPVHWSARFQAWMLTRHEDVREALRNAGTFASNDREHWPALAERFAEPACSCARQWLPLATRVLVGQDPPLHSRLRPLLSQALTPRRMRALQSAIQRHAETLAAELRAHSEFDLAAQFAGPLSWRVLLELLGISQEDPARFESWAEAHRRFVSGLLDADAAALQQAAGDLALEWTWLQALIARRRDHPGDDLVSALVQVRHEGGFLTVEEIAHLVHFLLLVAGHETTASLIAIGAWELLRNPAQWHMLVQDPSHIPAAVEELLRYVSPAFLLHRVVRRDISLHGRSLRRGDRVYLVIGAANRDPEVFRDPETLDITRDNAASLALGSGPHACVGALLARLEAPAALAALRRHFPRMTWNGEAVGFEPSLVIRKAQAIRVRTR
jgi:cytochrome P450